MERLRDISRFLGKQFDVIVKVAFLVWAFGIAGWCLARVVDRSEWIVSNQHLVGESVHHYVLVVFWGIPIACAIAGGMVFCKTKPSVVAALFISSVGLYLWVG